MADTTTLLSGFLKDLRAGTLGVLETITSLVAGSVGFTTAVTAGTTLLLSATAPTVGSGFGTSPAILSSNGTGTFRINVGTGGAATSGVITLPAAANGWNAVVSDLTGGIATRVTASSATSITITGASAWAASSTLVVMAMAY